MRPATTRAITAPLENPKKVYSVAINVIRGDVDVNIFDFFSYAGGEPPCCIFSIPETAPKPRL